MRKIIAVMLLFLALTLISCGKNSDFIIKDGVLTEYRGTNTAVEIPSKVKEIADFAFSKSPACDGITEITLGKNVEKISPKAFFGLYGLVKIDSAENPFFITEFQEYDNAYALYSKYQPMIFYFPDKEMHSITGVTENEYYCQDERITLAVSDAFFEIGFREDDYDGNRYWNVFSVSYGEAVKKFTEEERISGNIGIYAFETSEAFVFMKKRYNESDSYFFVGDKVLEEKNLNDYSVDFPISFYSEGNALKYIKMAGNYSILTSGTNVMDMCLLYTESRDEFCAEYGRVEITDAGLSYIPEKTYNISEYLKMRGTSIDECFEKSCYSEIYNSLDELLSANRKRMEETN